MTSFVDDNGNFLDYSGEDILLTKQSISVLNFQIKGEVSINFKLPNNNPNRRTLGIYTSNQVNSPAFSKTIFNQIRNGNTVGRGYLVIQRIEKEIECYYVAGNANWFSDFEFNIQNINYNDFVSGTSVWTYNHILTRVSSTEGVVYPFVDWMYNRQHVSRIYTDYLIRTDSTFDPETVSDFYPCFYLKSLWEYVFREAGYKYAGNLFLDQLFNSTIITPDSGDLSFSEDYISARAAKTVIKTSQVVTGGVNTKIATSAVYPNPNFTESTNSWIVYGNYSLSFTVNIITNVNQAYTLTLSPSGSTVILTGATLSYTWDGLNIPTGVPMYISIQGAAGFTISVGSTINYSIKKTVRYSNFVQPNVILPAMSGIDLIKAISIRFGCVVTFDEVSKTINFNKIDKITNTDDWSGYFVSKKSIYEQGFKNNFIRVTGSEEVTQYNAANSAGYGETNLQTPFDVNLDKDLYTDPFPAVVDSVMGTPPGWVQSYIPLLKLSDSDAIAFTSVTNVGSYAVLNGTGFDVLTFSTIRVYDSTGYYTGYHYVTAQTSTTITLNTYFTVNTSGNFYKQDVSYNQAGSRLLINVPNYSISNLGLETSIDIDTTTSSPVNYTAWNFAYFSKPVTGYGADKLRQSLSYGTINLLGYNDIPLDVIYLNKIKQMLSGPIERCQFLLPESVYVNYKSDKWIYLKTENLTGLFQVERITNYKDSVSLVEIDLLPVQ